MVISRRLVIGLIGAGAIAVALYAVPLAPALSPESRNARLDQTLRGLVEGRSTPGIVVLILQDGQPVYRRSVGGCSRCSLSAASAARCRPAWRARSTPASRGSPRLRPAP